MVRSGSTAPVGELWPNRQPFSRNSETPRFECLCNWMNPIMNPRHTKILIGRPTGNSPMPRLENATSPPHLSPPGADTKVQVPERWLNYQRQRMSSGDSGVVEETSNAGFVDLLGEQINHGGGFVPFIGSGCSSPSGILMDEYLSYTFFYAWQIPKASARQTRPLTTAGGTYGVTDGRSNPQLSR